MLSNSSSPLVQFVHVFLGQCEVHPKFGENFFDQGQGFYHTETKQVEFLQAMHMFSKQDSPYVLKHLDLKPYSTACDLGGKTI